MSLTRRRFLRTAGVSLALPWLDAFAPTRVLGADAEKPRRRVVCVEWIDPLFGCGHWTPELVQLAGGEECLGRPGQPAERVSATAVRAVDPEVVVVMPCGFGLERSHDEAARCSTLPGLGA